MEPETLLLSSAEKFDPACFGDPVGCMEQGIANLQCRGSRLVHFDRIFRQGIKESESRPTGLQ